MSDDEVKVRLPALLRELERGEPWYTKTALVGRARRVLRWLTPRPPEARVVAVLWASMDWRDGERVLFQDLIRVELRLRAGWFMVRDVDVTMYLQDHSNTARPPLEQAQRALENHGLVREVRRLWAEGKMDQETWRTMERETTRMFLKNVVENW